MLTKNLYEQTAELAELIQYAREYDEIEDESQEFYDLAETVIAAAKREDFADMETLIRLTFLVQEQVKTEWFVLRQAAGFLGLSYATLRDAVSADKLKARKPGHDYWVSAAEVRRYNDEHRKYPLRRYMKTVSP